MKNIIYCFTGSGNSLKIAREIAAGLEDCHIIRVSEHLMQELSSQKTDGAASIGFCFPVYSWGPPELINRLAALLPLDALSYCYAAVTCGGSPGGTVPFLNRVLKKRGRKLSAGFVFKMPTNYIAWSGALPEEKQQQMFAAASERIPAVTTAIRERTPRKLEKSALPLRLLGAPVYRLTLKIFPGLDKQFLADEKCNGCSVCTKVCPVGNISLEENRPVWHHRCQQCYGCIQWCPQEAIQLGKKTAARSRYHHPEIQLKEMFID